MVTVRDSLRIYSRLVDFADLVEDGVDFDPLHAQVVLTRGLLMIQRADARTASELRPEHMAPWRACLIKLRGFRSKERNHIDRRERGKMSRPAIVRNQHVGEPKDHQELPQRGPAGQTETAL